MYVTSQCVAAMQDRRNFKNLGGDNPTLNSLINEQTTKKRVRREDFFHFSNKISSHLLHGKLILWWKKIFKKNTSILVYVFSCNLQPREKAVNMNSGLIYLITAISAKIWWGRHVPIHAIWSYKKRSYKEPVIRF